MYLLPPARGRGIGKDIILKCLDAAVEEGFGQVYIETMPELKKAIELYERFGFRHLEAPLGHTGHFGCSTWMLWKKDGGLHIDGGQRQ
jgi:putative acetyltransferase